MRAVNAGSSKECVLYVLVYGLEHAGDTKIILKFDGHRLVGERLENGEDELCHIAKYSKACHCRDCRENAYHPSEARVKLRQWPQFRLPGSFHNSAPTPFLSFLLSMAEM
jgi:hypothetical protein